MHVFTLKMMYRFSSDCLTHHPMPCYTEDYEVTVLLTHVILHIFSVPLLLPVTRSETQYAECKLFQLADNGCSCLHDHHVVDNRRHSFTLCDVPLTRTFGFAIRRQSYGWFQNKRNDNTTSCSFSAESFTTLKLISRASERFKELRCLGQNIR